MPITSTKELAFIFILVIIAISSGLDMAIDLSHGAAIDHLIKEGVLLAIALVTIAWLIYGIHGQSRQIADLKNQLEEASNPRQVAQDYVIEARKQFGDVVNQQFNDWNLTSSEAEVGWLLLKGLSLKEIAAVRNTLEKTVRQQASSIYKKADVCGRHAFAAWFIEDLM